ncbi:MAG: TRAP transporter substrate-binding protein DctP [Pseudomonadota bacterium]|nr:TRAP transporter substrate-binding protein DctP [Pseudomonadota bacterium]
MTGGRTRRAVLAAGGALAVTACGAPGPRRDVLAALAGAANSPVNGVWIWMDAFARTLREGGMSVEVSANSALGSEPDRTEMTGLGLLHANDAGITEVMAYSDAYRAPGLPFLLDDIDHFERFIAAPEFRAWLASELDPAGLVFADAALLGGMSGLFTARTPIRQIADVERLRLRAMGRLDLLMIEALGASGVQVAWEEVPQALQTGIAQGYFNPPLAPVLFGHGSQIGYFLDLNMSAAHRAILLSARWLDSLTPQRRALVDRAVAAGHRANRDWARNGREREMAALAGIDIEVIQPDPALRRTFAERVRGAYRHMAPPSAVDRFLAMARESRS